MVTSNYYYLLSTYVIFAVFAIVTWYFVRKSASDSFIRKAMGKQFCSAATWFVIADLALLIFVPDSIDWVMNIGILGIAILCYVVGVLILNSYHENDEEYFENISEHTIAIYFSKCDNNYCAKVSDNVPGTLVFTADSFTELLEEAPKSLRFHIEGMLKDGDDVPEWLANNDYDIEFVPKDNRVQNSIRERQAEKDEFNEYAMHNELRTSDISAYTSAK